MEAFETEPQRLSEKPASSNSGVALGGRRLGLSVDLLDDMGVRFLISRRPAGKPRRAAPLTRSTCVAQDAVLIGRESAVY